MKRILTSFALVAASVAFSQVSISGNTDDTPKATLDVKAISGKTNGVLVPRVSRADADVMPIPVGESTIEESTLIYIDNIGGVAPSGYATDVDAEGFYYFKGGKWVKLDSSYIKHPVYISTEGSDKIIREYAGSTAITYTDNDFMIILTNGSVNGQLSLPPASQNKGRIIWLINGTTRGLGFSGNNLNRTEQNYPFNFTVIPVRGSAGFVSDGNTWYTLTTSR